MSPAKKVFEGGVEAMYASDLVALDDGAVDDSEDLDDDFVNVQKTMNDVRRGMSIAKGDNRIQDMLPFHFSPNCRPLTVSDLDSCDALEQAAFSDPKYRCSREKVSFSVFPSSVPVHRPRACLACCVDAPTCPCPLPRPSVRQPVGS